MLSYCRISDEGAKALAHNTTLTMLNLSYCNIGKESAAALALNKTLTALYLSNNPEIGNIQQTAIDKRLTKNRNHRKAWIKATAFAAAIQSNDDNALKDGLISPLLAVLEFLGESKGDTKRD
jgi:hypothetical protein